MYNAAENIEAYIAQAPDSRLLRQVLCMVQNVYPKEKFRYFDNGKTFASISLGKNFFPSPGYEEAGAINITSQKNYVAIYFYSDNPIWQTRLPKSAVGKGCLRIKNQIFLEKYEKEVLEILKNIKLDKPHDKGC